MLAVQRNNASQLIDGSAVKRISADFAACARGIQQGPHFNLSSAAQYIEPGSMASTTSVVLVTFAHAEQLLTHRSGGVPMPVEPCFQLEQGNVVEGFSTLKTAASAGPVFDAGDVAMIATTG